MNKTKAITASYLNQQLAQLKRDLKDELLEELPVPPISILTETALSNQLTTLKNELNLELKETMTALNKAYANTISECLGGIQASLADNFQKENKLLQGRVKILEERITYLEHERDFYAHHKGRRKKLEREVIDMVNDAMERKSSEIMSQKSEFEDHEHDDDTSPTSKKKEVFMKLTANSKFCADVLKNKLKMNRKPS